MSEKAGAIAEIVKSALELPPGERGAFLDEACAGDAGIRAEVDSFLQFQDEASQFIEQGALHQAAQTAAREPGMPLIRQVDGYEVISRIGVGGMGEVYLAHDTKLKRRVALKLVRAGMDSADLVSRFRHEERILASLNHPNIAQLYGAGVANGDIPYFAMEYVEGNRIDEYCEANSLSARARLELFRKVCGAVHYAHQRLVIHRDLKPSNILVTADGEPKLLDFGIAKLVEGQDAFTQVQTLAGVMTPDYASPEQVRGEAMTTSTDVYSLGVLLYELLTGQRPYRLKTRRADEIARAITDQEPERPSTVLTKVDHPPSSILDSRSLRGDIDNIVLMALRKEPQRRYASVEQFSEDIHRHLEGRPVIAHKDTIAYRAAKFVKRQKLAVAAALLIVGTLIAAVILTTRQQRRAERRFNDVRQLSNALLTDIAPKIERLQGATEARQSVLTQSLKYLDSLAKESAGDPALQSELAAAYEKVGDLQGTPTNPNLIALGDALKSYEKAHEIRQQLIAHDPRNPEQRRLLANNYRVLGDLRWQTNEPAESRKNSEAALRIYTELLAENPGSTELRLPWIQTTYDIGQGLSTNEKYAESIGYFQRAIAAAEELRQQSPNRVDVLKALGNCRRQLGNSLAWEGKQKEAEAEMEVALAIYEPLAAANPTDVSVRAGLYQTYMQASSLYEEVNDALATEYGLKALRIISENVEKDPANVRAKQQMAKTYSRLGVTLDNEGKSAESIVYLEKAVALLQEMVRSETKNRRFTHDLATAFIRLGDSRRKQHNFSAAVLDLEKAAAILLELAKSDRNDNASLRNLANASASLAKAHEELAKTADAADARSHRQSAREQLRRAVDSLGELQTRNALSKYDRKSLEELQLALQKSANDQ
jgi:tetratricopeptide (TPR) repeat protein/tRNA A-37 threonylcarbamoyl transferase component Bud32